ncbi:hypothetical protein P691DRAFT_451102 [Macrolepiota fuliginosa MF-IS2]|uniref:C2H2-type domain-containing protein n=1 Tax=Macrolepiota fuliginosa MF-IS2 TaxID=1400762 RepID=A0A9P6C3Z0_9AGAR|nr:hypothetical protein P691DRAFT_451102 [Macrolepiota fuliginosa MF-IS2]
MSSPSAPNAVTIQTLPSEPLALRRTRRKSPRGEVYPIVPDSGPAIVSSPSAEVPGQVPPSTIPAITHIPDERVLRKRPTSNQFQSPSPPLPTEKSTSRTLRKTGCRSQRQLSGMGAISKMSEVPPNGTMHNGEQISHAPMMRLSVCKGSPQDEWSSPEPPNFRGRKRQQDESDFEDGDGQKLEARLMEWGFVRRGKTLHCPCGKTFSRRWDAGRHWMNASIHKAERQRLGDFSDSIKYRCTGCNEVLSRKDSLQRHMAKCGLRKKRRYRGGWDPNAVRFTS